MTLEDMISEWRDKINALPDDGAPVVVEEMFPLGSSKGVSFTALLQGYLNATKPRGVG